MSASSSHLLLPERFACSSPASEARRSSARSPRRSAMSAVRSSVSTSAASSPRRVASARAAVQLHRGPVEIAAVGVNARQREHRMQGSQVIVQLARKIQRLFQEGERGFILSENPQYVAAQRQHPIALRIGIDGVDVDALELGLGRRKLAVLARGVGAHEARRPYGRFVARARDGFEPPLDRVDVLVAGGVRVNHAADFEQLDFRCCRAARQGRRRIDDLRRPLGIRPLEHFELIGIGRLRRPRRMPVRRTAGMPRLARD